MHINTAPKAVKKIYDNLKPASVYGTSQKLYIQFFA